MQRMRIITLAASLSALAGAASAQSMNTPSASFNSGWGSSPGQESRPVALRNGRDGNGNRLIVDGVMQTGSDQSSYAHSDTSGAYDKGAGAGYGGSTAIGNNLLVSVNGSWNTVIVDSTQINNGDVIATGKVVTGELNGGLDLHD